MLTLSLLHSPIHSPFLPLPFSHLSPPSLHPFSPHLLLPRCIYMYLDHSNVQAPTYSLSLSPTVQGELPSSLLSVMVVRGEVRVVPVVESEHCEDATQGLWDNSLFLKEGDAGIIVSEASCSTCPLSLCLSVCLYTVHCVRVRRFWSHGGSRAMRKLKPAH